MVRRRSSIGRITPPGEIERIRRSAKVSNRGACPRTSRSGAEGNIWFTDNGTTKAIGEITPSRLDHRVRPKARPAKLAANIDRGPGAETSGFFTSGLTKTIGQDHCHGHRHRIPRHLNPMSKLRHRPLGPMATCGSPTREAPRDRPCDAPSGEITEFSPGLLTGANRNAIVAGADGNLWFSDMEDCGDRARQPDGHVEIHAGPQPGKPPDALTVGPDGNVWFIDQRQHAACGRPRCLPDRTITEFTQGLSQGLPLDIATAADGNLWVYQGQPGGDLARARNHGRRDHRVHLGPQPYGRPGWQAR